MPKVTLVMAGGPGFPGGSPDHRYELAVTLDGSGRLDPQAWYDDPAPWPARRVWANAPDRAGDVQFDPDSGWSLRFFPVSGEAADAPLHGVFKGPIIMRPGEYLTIREPEGEEYSYRIVSTG